MKAVQVTSVSEQTSCPMPEVLKSSMLTPDTKLNERLEIRNDIPIPQPGVAELLVRITSSSLCASDVAAQQGVSPVTLPFCAGHERMSNPSSKERPL